jgi:hypothetical protein
MLPRNVFEKMRGGNNMKRIVTACVVLGLVAILAFPFVRDAYNRHQLISKLGLTMTERDRLAFRSWDGDANSFARSLLNRCKLENGPDAATCEPFRLALKD